MPNLNDYTISQIINKYKEFLGENPERIISKYIDIERKIRKGETINVLLEIIEKNPDIDNIKLEIVSKIYNEYSEQMTPKQLAEIKQLILRGEKFSIIEFPIDNEISDYEIITSQKKKDIYSIDNKETRELLEFILDVIDITDLESNINQKFEQNISSYFLKKLTNNFFLKQKQFTLSKYKKMLKEGNFDEVRKNYENDFKEEVINFFKNNIQYLNVTNLLYNFAARLILGINLVKMVEGRKIGEEKQKDIQGSINYLKKVYNELKSNKHKDFVYGIELEDGSMAIKLDKKGIKDYLDRCTDNDYISDNDVEYIHKQIQEGFLTDVEKERKIANINIQDLINLNRSYEETEDNDTKKNMINCGKELIEYLKDEKEVDNEVLLEMYIKGYIDFDIVKNAPIHEFSSKFYNEKFKTLYEAMIYSIEQGKNIKDSKSKETNVLIRFSKLYKELMNNKKTDSDSLIEDLIIRYGEDSGCELLCDLYDLEIATVEKCLEWVGTDFLVAQYKKGELKPVKVRELYEESIISEDDIAKVIKTAGNPAEMMTLIGAIFSEESIEDDEMRTLLTDECMKTDEATTDYLEERIKKEKEKTDKNSNEEKIKAYTMNITDPFARLYVMQTLDKDYSFYMTKDGYAIFRVPSSKKVIIEKMFDKDNIPSYGQATYILDEEYYERNKFKILDKEGKVKRVELTRNLELKEVNQIIHHISKWGEEIKKCLEIKSEKYPEEYISKIDEAIERFKRSITKVRS